MATMIAVSAIRRSPSYVREWIAEQRAAPSSSSTRTIVDQLVAAVSVQGEELALRRYRRAVEQQIWLTGAMYAQHVDPRTAFQALAVTADGDPFAWENSIWSRAGVVNPTGTDSGSLTTRNSFPARRAATRVIQEIMGVDSDSDD